MKKSRLGDLFNEESGSSDKSLLTYHGPNQPGVSRSSADSPPPETSNSPSTSTKHTPDVESPLTAKPQEGYPPSTGTGASPATGAATSPSSGNTAATPDIMTAPELLHSCVVSAFTFSGSQSVSLGSLGCALYWEPSRHRSLLVLYRSRQQQICLLTLTQTSLPAFQPRLYVSFRCDAGRQFSVHLASQSALREFAMKTVLAAALASGAAAALTLPMEDEVAPSGGRRARVGDILQLEVTEWSVQKPRSEQLRQRGATGSVSATLDDGSWRAVLGGARPGQRWLAADPATLEFVREVLAVTVRPPPRQAPLQLPADDGTDWQPGDEAGSLSSESPPSPPPSPSAVDVDQTKTDARARAEEESDPRAGPEEDATAAAAARGRAGVLARMARLGQQMFPSAAGTGREQSPSPPPSPPPSPARRSPSPAARNSSSRPLSPSNRQTASTTSAAVEAAGVIRASAGSKPAVAARLPPGPRPPVAPRPDATELCVLFGRLEAKLGIVLSRLEPAAGVAADAETLAAGVRKLAAENATLRETSRQAGRATELRLESERARAAMATELADSLAELTETKRKLADAQRRLATVEDTASEVAAAAAAKRETELEAQLAAAKSAAAAAAKGSADAAEAAAARVAREPRRLLRGVYKTLRSRLPAEATFTGAEVGEIVAEVVREALQMVEAETVAGQAETQAAREGGSDKETGSRRGSVPPFVTEDECIEEGDE